MIDLRRHPVPPSGAVYVRLPRPAWVPATYPDDPAGLADRLDAHARDTITLWDGWIVAGTSLTRHAPDLTATVAREPVSEAMLALAVTEAEGGAVLTYEAPCVQSSQP